MRFLVKGADATDGTDLEMVVEAETIQQAEFEATQRNVFVSSTRLLNGSAPVQVPLPTRSHGYRRVVLFGRTVMVLVVIGLGAVAVMNRGNPKAEDTSTPTKNHEKFHKSVQPFVKELRGLLGRMDAGLSFFDFNQKLGDLAAAYRGIADAQDGPSERDRDRAEKAYKAFIAVRKAWGEKIANSNAPDMRETFDLACEEAAAQARVFLQHHEVGEE